MFMRFTLYMLVMIGLLFLAESCQRSVNEASNLVHVRVAGGKAYALMQYFDSDPGSTGATFGIATPKNAAWSEWNMIADNRIGPVMGLATLPADLAGKVSWEPATSWVPSEDQPPEGTSLSSIPAASYDRLLTMFDRRVSVFDPTQDPPTHHSEPLPFSWAAETGVAMNGKLYLIGAEKSSDDKFYLRAAAYDGARWSVVPMKGPRVSLGRQGYYLQAVNEGAKARIFLRKWEPDQTLGIFQDGAGPLETLLFDGETFGPVVSLNYIPAGNISVFSTADGVKMLIQTRAPPEQSFTRNGVMELWRVDSDGSAKQVEVIEESNVKPGVLPFIFAEYAQIGGQEYILRSNTQFFEAWKRDANGNWAFIRRPQGLKTFDMETKLLMLAGIGMALIAFGAGVAYRRRKIALAQTRKIEAQELYASLGLRAGAYAVDCVVTGLAGYLLAMAADSASAGILGVLIPSADFPIPYLPFFLAYMAYFTLSEWLLGATLGKRIMGLRVVMDGGAPLTFWAALVRNFTGFYERQLLFAAIASSMIVFGPRRQRLGDIFARTFVVQYGALEAFKKQRAAELAEMRDKLAAQSSGLSVDEKKDGK